MAVYDASEVQKVAFVDVEFTFHTDSSSDLAMRDSYFDMLDEPNAQYIVNNRNYDIWHSPDLWNRDTADGGLVPQDPQYFSSRNPSRLYVRVKNVGCAANTRDASELRLYWTYGSTGEHWDADWIGTNMVKDSANTLTLPAGQEITSTGNFPVVPVLQPGQDESFPQLVTFKTN